MGSMRAREVVQLVEYLPNMHKTLTSIPTTEDRKRRKEEKCKIDNWGLGR